MSPSAHEGAVNVTDAERFQLLVDAVTDYAIYMLDPKGFVTSWNAGAQRITGYTAEEIIGQHFARFFTPEDQTFGLPARTLAEAKSKGRFESEGWRVRKDGTRFWAVGVLQALTDRSGRPLGFAQSPSRRENESVPHRRYARVAISISVASASSIPRQARQSPRLSRRPSHMMQSPR